MENNKLDKQDLEELKSGIDTIIRHFRKELLLSYRTVGEFVFLIAFSTINILAFYSIRPEISLSTGLVFFSFLCVSGISLYALSVLREKRARFAENTEVIRLQIKIDATRLGIIVVVPIPFVIIFSGIWAWIFFGSMWLISGIVLILRIRDNFHILGTLQKIALIEEEFSKQ